ncbi:MAG: ATP-binding protein [Ruminiclostridium sp.]|nr:ATP-binding protein [Ruminiclostridium sp.]
MKEIRVKAVDEELNNVISFVEEQLESVDCAPRIIVQVNIAVEEIFVNIAHYAYEPETGEAVIRFEFQKEPDAAVITFIDSGKPYNPLEKPDPDVTLSAEKRQIGGLGIFMVKKSMDDMRYEYSNCRNILTIIKAI